MRFDPKLTNSYLSLPRDFYNFEKAESFPHARLIRLNGELAKFLNLPIDGYPKSDMCLYFSGQYLPATPQSIALCYGGHQFGHYAGRLGDGRALLLGQVRAKDQKNYDIQLKGSGPTLYSRRGDGFSALGPTLREYIVSEFMAAMNIPTTRALSVCATGRAVHREQSEPGGVFTRVASSHIRVGTFEYFAAKGDNKNLEILFKYSSQRHCPHVLASSQPHVEFFRHVLVKQAKLIASWMSIGFIHGVMNTDNTAISGETLDFGPCAFMDEFKSDKVFSYIDQRGRYAYRNQPSIIQWNLARLAECLSLLLNDNETLADLRCVLDEFIEVFDECYRDNMAQRLGILQPTSNDQKIINQWLELLTELDLDFNQSFWALSQYHSQLKSSYLPVKHKAMDLFLNQWQQRIGRQNDEDTQDLMLRSNPCRIPRNHMIEKVISDAYEGDLSSFHLMCDATAAPYQKRSEWSIFDVPPLTEEKVRFTFCGT